MTVHWATHIYQIFPSLLPFKHEDMVEPGIEVTQYISALKGVETALQKDFLALLRRPQPPREDVPGLPLFQTSAKTRGPFPKYTGSFPDV